jgi:hypothetical protein
VIQMILVLACLFLEEGSGLPASRQLPLQRILHACVDHPPLGTTHAAPHTPHGTRKEGTSCLRVSAFRWTPP